MEYTDKEPENMDDGWIGVDLDGTLAHYDQWRGIEHIGDPIEPMVDRVTQWLSNGRNVKIFTARLAVDDHLLGDVVQHIQEWCKKHIGRVLEVTNQKDSAMIELWDDRCIQVQTNTGGLMTDIQYDEGYEDGYDNGV